MRAKLLWTLGLPALLLASAATGFVPPSFAADEDPDLPNSIAPVDKNAYLQARSEYIARLRGVADDPTGQLRVAAVQDQTERMQAMGPFTSSAAWSPIGPYPIPNGQTTTVRTNVSGRVTSIVVDPTDANIVYVGTAQGGVYRSMNGGTTWTPIFDSAASLAIGALALAPSDPTILYVGTGEANQSADSFFGVGLYRIDNAKTAPVLNGPFNPTPTTDVIGAKTFTGRSISRILVDSADPATIFVSTGGGIGGIGGEPFASSPPVSALRGVYRSTNGTSGSPSFAKLTVTPAGSIAPDVTGNRIINDMIYDPTDATGNTICVWVYSTGTVAGEGGIYRTTNAKGAGTFAQTFQTTLTTANSRGNFAACRVASVTTMYVATYETPVAGCSGSFGAIRQSLDGGATWSAKLAGGAGFCGGQCWYDSPIAVHPGNPLIVLIGGGGNSGSCSRTYGRSTDGGTTFTIGGVQDIGLHADAHAIAFAPSDPTVVYEGNDGGIWKSTDTGLTWTSMNTAGFSATQFQSIDVHPIDANFSIGGTQDNGTDQYLPSTAWAHADDGDGGFAVIDQNAPDNTNVTMYHTYFNARGSVVAYAYVIGNGSPSPASWSIRGQNANGLALTEYCNFYAPLVRGPGNPNTIYYATDRLHRSTDNGFTNPVASPAPIGAAGVTISAVGIAPSNDNVRLIATNNFNVSTGAALSSIIYGTVTGSSALTNMTQAGMPVAKYISRFAIDPTNANVAYVCFGGFNIPAGQHVWKTTNLLTGTPTWAASGSGLPDVPVNAFAVDPANPSQVFAGTDVGVYISNDGGANWFPYTTGMPVVAVFDMAIQASNRILRVATHGRGMWERLIDTATPTLISVVGTEIVGGHVRLSWYMPGGEGKTINLYRRPVPGDWAKLGTITADGTGALAYEDAAVVAGRSFEYTLGIVENGKEEFAGQVWVDVPAGVAGGIAVDRVAPNPSNARTGFNVSFTLPKAGPATLEMVDITGRRVASREVGSMGAGRHDVSFGRDAAFKPGVYWARLNQAGRTVARKAIVTQ